MTALREEYPHTNVETLCNPWPRLVPEVLFREGLPSAPNKPIHTTNSNHVYRKYPNLAKGLEVRHVNHVWVADITYVWIEGDVLYLHLVTDAFSHAVIGWCLTETLEADGTVRALEMAVETAGGGNLCATIHHSDRGSQPT